MSKLLEEVRDLIRTRHYSYRTEEAYLNWIRQYILFHGRRHPAEMGADQVTEFLTHLAVKRQVVHADDSNSDFSIFHFGLTFSLPTSSFDPASGANQSDSEGQNRSGQKCRADVR